MVWATERLFISHSFGIYLCCCGCLMSSYHCNSSTLMGKSLWGTSNSGSPDFREPFVAFCENERRELGRLDRNGLTRRRKDRVRGISSFSQESLKVVPAKGVRSSIFYPGFHLCSLGVYLVCHATVGVRRVNPPEDRKLPIAALVHVLIRPTKMYAHIPAHLLGHCKRKP